MNDALEGQKRPPPGVRPAPLPEVAWPQVAVTVGYVAAVAPSLAVVRELNLLHDDRHRTVPPPAVAAGACAGGGGGEGAGRGEEDGGGGGHEDAAA